VASAGETSDLVIGEDGSARCRWGASAPDYIPYHDEEWGRPLHGADALFERICLEAFQSGLSWLTILRKREAFRAAFLDFDFERIARFTARDVERMLGDANIIRHRGKIESTSNNARRASELVNAEGSLSSYFWRWQPDTRARPRRLTKAALMKLGVPDEARSLSKDLKARGWTFVGPTTVYAFMEAMGLVNDHLDGCVIRGRVGAGREPARRPRAIRGE
jgi:DNA-3-methyladenine glycosylase I